MYSQWVILCPSKCTNAKRKNGTILLHLQNISSRKVLEIHTKYYNDPGDFTFMHICQQKYWEGLAFPSQHYLPPLQSWLSYLIFACHLGPCGGQDPFQLKWLERPPMVVCRLFWCETKCCRSQTKAFTWQHQEISPMGIVSIAIHPTDQKY